VTIYDAWLTAPGVPENEPTRWFPDGRAAFFYLQDGIQSGRLAGEQVDHLVWRATMSRTDIEAALVELLRPVGDFEARHSGVMEHIADRMRRLRAFVLLTHIRNVPSGGDNALNAWLGAAQRRYGRLPHQQTRSASRICHPILPCPRGCRAPPEGTFLMWVNTSSFCRCVAGKR
jgi:hypothetical protein